MKRVNGMVKPYLSLVFGSLLFLIYLNALSGTGGNLAIGIVGVLLSAYYIGIGLSTALIKKKLPAIFETLSLTLYPVFYFVVTLIAVINGGSAMGPTSWVIQILSMVAALGFPGVYLLVCFGKNPGPWRKPTLLLSAIFALALLLDLLFTFVGNPITLGQFSLISAVVYGLYVAIAIGPLLKATVKSDPQPSEEKEEGPEEAPTEE